MRAKKIYELFIKYDIRDYQRLKDLLNRQKEEFNFVSYFFTF